jgi:hypothetical protein
MRFCYHPDNQIYNDSGYVSTYEEFMAANPGFPIVEGDFLEYKEGKLTKINEQGHHFPAVGEYENLIQAINNLEDE